MGAGHMDMSATWRCSCGTAKSTVLLRTFPAACAPPPNRTPQTSPPNYRRMSQDVCPPRSGNRDQLHEPKPADPLPSCQWLRRQLTFTPTGVIAEETANDPSLTDAIRAHAREVTGFVQEGMPAMMQQMMGPGGDIGGTGCGGMMGRRNP